MDIVSRQQAHALGLSQYFTGEPCRAGHVARRMVSNWTCCECVNARHRAERAANPDLYRGREKARRERDPVAYRARMRAQWAKHRDKRLEADRARYRRNPEPYKVRAKQWQKRNPAMLRWFCARRRAAKLRATPKWLTREQRRLMRWIYIWAASLPGDFHVDHIVPLRGENVCGLNVPWNLQILPADRNRRKGNRLENDGADL